MSAVQVISRENVVPSSPTPPHLRAYKLSLIDQFYASSHVTVTLFYPHSHQPIAERLRLLKSSLSRILTRYYPLAGRLKGNSTVDCSDQGVDLLTARAPDVHLTQLLRHPEDSHLGHLLPCGASCVEEYPSRGTLLSLQLTAFACDGIAIGACICHKVADGTSLVTFLNAWAAEARGAVAECGPDLGMASRFWPIEPAPDNFETGLKEGLVLRRFAIGGPAVDSLRAAAKNGYCPTRVVAVIALLWRCIIRARGRAGSKGAAAAVLSVDMRRRMVPPMPEHAFGNLITAQVASVVKGGNNDDDDWERCLLQRLRDAVGRVDSEYVRRLQGPEGVLWASEAAREFAESAGSADWYGFSSWCRFPIYETDFGFGVPIWVAIGKVSGMNDIKLVDRISDGGVEAWVTIKEEEMAELERDEELCSFASPHPVIV